MLSATISGIKYIHKVYTIFPAIHLQKQGLPIIMLYLLISPQQTLFHILSMGSPTPGPS